MKWNHKCVCCDKQATKRWKGRWFCETHLKELRRHRKARYAWAEKHVWSIGNLKVYIDVPVKLKNKRKS